MQAAIKYIEQPSAHDKSLARWKHKTTGLCGLRPGQILNAGDVQKDAFRKSLSDRIGIEVKRDLHAIPFDEHHVVVADVVAFAIGCVNAEWSERVFLHSISEFCYGNHGVTISFRVMGFKC
ncbi:MAG: hypothetical protein ABSC18_04625 [Verrucomicrobiota bacterium]